VSSPALHTRSSEESSNETRTVTSSLNDISDVNRINRFLSAIQHLHNLLAHMIPFINGMIDY
jgi:hypothetical protein